MTSSREQDERRSFRAFRAALKPGDIADRQLQVAYKHRLPEIGLLAKRLDVRARQFRRICRSGGTAEVTHRDLVADNVRQNTAGVHVTRRFQQPGSGGCCSLSRVLSRPFAGRRRPLFRALC